jgi:hypothetical protein|tara:strand:- start:4525 stop:4986 length:462 start_codon:yes stop_codon:yes gene_type:complete
MSIVTTPAVLESFAENRIKTLIETQVTRVPDVNILTGHTIEDDSIDQEAPVVVITVVRDEEDIPGTGWWACSIEVELDPRDLDDESTDSTMLEIETALGDGDGSNKIEAQLTNGRLLCMTGSVFYDSELAYNPTANERIRTFTFSASLGLTAS